MFAVDDDIFKFTQIQTKDISEFMYYCSYKLDKIKLQNDLQRNHR